MNNRYFGFFVIASAILGWMAVTAYLNSGLVSKEESPAMKVLLKPSLMKECESYAFSLTLLDRNNNYAGCQIPNIPNFKE